MFNILMLHCGISIMLFCLLLGYLISTTWLANYLLIWDSLKNPFSQSKTGPFLVLSSESLKYVPYADQSHFLLIFISDSLINNVNKKVIYLFFCCYRCEAFSTYPRTYDLIHANGVFSLYKDK